MADVIEAKVLAGTHTGRRFWSDTETPKEIVEFSDMDDRAGKTINNLVDALSSCCVIYFHRRLGSESRHGVTQPRQSKLCVWDRLASQAGMLRFVSGGEEHTTAPPHIEALLDSPTHQQANATPITPDEEYFFRHMRRTHWNIAQRAPSFHLTLIDQQYIRFRGKLVATLLDEPIEDGVTHPAEGLIDEALRANSSHCLDWLSQVLGEHYPTRPSLCASIVRCIGRLDFVRVRGWGMRVVDDALQNSDTEVREAAIRALEAWGEPEALDMLRRHEDAEDWVNEYVQQVIVDLSGTNA